MLAYFRPLDCSEIMLKAWAPAGRGKRKGEGALAPGSVLCISSYSQDLCVLDPCFEGTSHRGNVVKCFVH